MEIIPNITNEGASAMQKNDTTDVVTSKDGTTIGYRQYGHGPGIVLVQGAMGSVQNYADLAELLSDTFTVYVPDRRGRGLSPLPYSKDYSIQKDVEDLDMLLTKTGAHAVFGLSAGALITLQAALTLPAIHRAIIFEPPLFLDESNAPTGLVTRYSREIAQSKVAAALITGMKAAQMGPPVFNLIPRWLLEMMTNRIIKIEDEQGSGDYLSMRELASALQYDFEVVVEMIGKQESLRTIRAEVLLLGGSESPTYLKAALGALEQVLPQARRIELPGLSHGSPWNFDKQRNPAGKPEPVAQELRRFFAEP